MADNKPSKELSEYDKYRIVRSNSKNIRLDFYHNRVKFYPEKKTINISAEMNFSGGYTQDGKIEVSKNEVETFLGGTPDKLVALNADGSVGQNTAAGRYGAWFDAKGNTAEFNWGNVHAYIESNDLYSWAYGCHPHNCRKGDAHTVQMQYQRGSKTVDVMVTFTIK